MHDISKFNPNHDELGRFTSAGGGRRVSAMPKRKNKPNIKRTKEKNNPNTERIVQELSRVAGKEIADKWKSFINVALNTQDNPKGNMEAPLKIGGKTFAIKGTGESITALGVLDMVANYIGTEALTGISYADFSSGKPFRIKSEAPKRNAGKNKTKSNARFGLKDTKKMTDDEINSEYKRLANKKNKLENELPKISNRVSGFTDVEEGLTLASRPYVSTSEIKNRIKRNKGMTRAITSRLKDLEKEAKSRGISPYSLRLTDPYKVRITGVTDFSEKVIEKFNPYHDELGRFTSGPGGNSKKVGPGGLLFHVSPKTNRKSIEQLGLLANSDNKLYLSEQPHVFDITTTDVYVVDTSEAELFPDTIRAQDRARKSYFSNKLIPSEKIYRLTGKKLKAVYETHNSFKWNPDIISKFNPYHDELGRFTSGPGGSGSISTKKINIKNRSQKLFQQLQKNGGFTFDTKRNNLRRNGSAVAVSQEYERTFSPKDFAVNGAKYIKQYMDDFAEQLSGTKMHIGGWFSQDNNKVYLDISVVTKTPEEAADIARKTNQLAFFDMSNFKTYSKWGGDNRYYPQYESEQGLTGRRRSVAYIAPYKDRDLSKNTGGVVFAPADELINDFIIENFASKIMSMVTISKDSPTASTVHLETAMGNQKKKKKRTKNISIEEIEKKKNKLVSRVGRASAVGDADDPRFANEGGRRFSAQWRESRLKELEEEAKKKKFPIKKNELKNPKGGLTQAGRDKFNRETGSKLKAGVKGKADTPEKMRRKGSFLTRFFTNPSGPMVNDKGEPTRLALSANAWGEPVPKNRSDAARLAEKGRKLLDRYENTKKVSKFNPNHDELGRFTSGSGGSRVKSKRPSDFARTRGMASMAMRALAGGYKSKKGKGKITVERFNPTTGAKSIRVVSAKPKAKKETGKQRNERLKTEFTALTDKNEQFKSYIVANSKQDAKKALAVKKYMLPMAKKFKNPKHRTYAISRIGQMTGGKPRPKGMSKKYGMNKAQVKSFEILLGKIFRTGRLKYGI